MSSHAQGAVPSQTPCIMGLQRSASRTLNQALPKSTSLPRTLITCRTQLTANSRAKKAETSHPVCGQDGQTCATKTKYPIQMSKYKLLNSSCLQLPFLLLGSSPVPPLLPQAFTPSMIKIFNVWSEIRDV
ncbi:hypothetical protein FHG87_000749 [Trinorchestia longiramus]|nr:hypothetical protein FHG87_000749 [Trinorchestia longiramus]